jgi:hypothetical protein
MMLERFSYRGWQNAYKVSNGVVELITTADVGPRILFYGFCRGENLFHEVEADAGKIGGSQFRLYGGHRLWVAPEVETTYYPDNAPVQAAEHGNAVRFTAPREAQPLGTNLQKELEIELGLTGSEVRITHRIRNDGTQPTKLAAWAPTMMRAGGRAILPFSPRIAMDKDHYLPVGVLSIWSYTDFADTRWSLGTSYSAPTGAKPYWPFQRTDGRHIQPFGLGSLFLRRLSFYKTRRCHRRRSISRFRLQF